MKKQTIKLTRLETKLREIMRSRKVDAMVKEHLRTSVNNTHRWYVLGNGEADMRREFRELMKGGRR